VIWNLPVVAEAKHTPLASAQQTRDLVVGWALPPGNPLGRFLYVFQQGHGDKL
jgi:hypothetical protein